jgi:hypothetical protein
MFQIIHCFRALSLLHCAVSCIWISSWCDCASGQREGSGRSNIFWQGHIRKMWVSQWIIYTRNWDLPRRLYDMVGDVAVGEGCRFYLWFEGGWELEWECCRGNTRFVDAPLPCPLICCLGPTWWLLELVLFGFDFAGLCDKTRVRLRV